MTVLVTGHRGLVGAAVCAELLSTGRAVRGYDIADGDDVRDAPRLESAMRGCNAVVHCAALLDAEEHGEAELFAVNVFGTRTVLECAARGGISRLVFLSSAAVLGVFQGQREPDYLPLDEAHPLYPRSAYALSKRLGEELCACYARNCGLTTICLRPPGIFTPEIDRFIRDARENEASFEWTPYWEFGAWIDARDVAGAVRCALERTLCGYHELLICADDISSARLSSRALAQQLLPRVAWRGGPEYETAPFRSLVDTRRARELLQWQPRFRWRSEA